MPPPTGAASGSLDRDSKQEFFQARTSMTDVKSRQDERRHRLGWAVGSVAVVYLVLAYLLVPVGWEVHERHHPAIEQAPRHARTKTGIPGDPLNVALVGTSEAVVRSLLAAGWHPADPITLESSLRIAADTVLRRPYVDAPVSSLYLWDRKQDLAFEQPSGHDPRQRHHVRFWQAPQQDDQGRPLWIGAATFDRAVGLSHTTGEVTHHIGPDVDAERDKLMSDLGRAGVVSATYAEKNFQSARRGKNGGGDPYYTDGSLRVAVLKP